jgi:putative DNA-invertase from lambdoid prophage Rac
MTFDGETKDPIQKAVRDARLRSRPRRHKAQAEATKVAQRAGIEHAKGRKDSPYLGRKPAFTRAQFAAVHDMLGKGTTSIVHREDDRGEAPNGLPAQGQGQ